MALRVNSHHQDELAKFLQFFRARLRTHLENVEADFEDTRSDRLSSDDVYSQKDIKDVLNSLCFAVKANVRSELQDTINMMAILLRQIFAEAEESKLALELDIAIVEDRELLERVERLSVAEWVDGSNGSASVAPLKRKTQNNSPSAKELLQQEKEKHEDEIRAVQHTAKQQSEDHAKELRRLERKHEKAQEKIMELERALEESQVHISQSKQFQAMKAMVTRKNDQLRDVRKRLQRYEPDYDDECETKNADDDDD